VAAALKLTGKIVWIVLLVLVTLTLVSVLFDPFGPVGLG
jgi:hypothetical protein